MKTSGPQEEELNGDWGKKLDNNDLRYWSSLVRVTGVIK
jgi:hypothetical protein